MEEPASKRRKKSGAQNMAERERRDPARVAASHISILQFCTVIENIHESLAYDGSLNIERLPRFMISKFASASHPGPLPVALCLGDAFRRKCAKWHP